MKKRMTTVEKPPEPITSPNWKVENVVATVSVKIAGDNADNGKIDLNAIARKYVDTEYNPERFPGLVMRVENPKATILIFSTGNMVVTGMRAAKDAPSVVNEVVGNLKKTKIKVTGEPEITIQNIVASGEMKTHVDLNEAAIVMDNAIYEPEVFPGLIYRMEKPKTVFLIFSTGRVVCTGAKTKEMVGEAMIQLAKDLVALELRKKEGDESGEQVDFI